MTYLIRVLIEALSAAILPVCNAFFVLLLVASLYAAVAVMVLGEREGFQDLFGILFLQFVDSRFLPRLRALLTTASCILILNSSLYEIRKIFACTLHHDSDNVRRRLDF
jgi:hypothetical protein